MCKKIFTVLFFCLLLVSLTLIAKAVDTLSFYEGINYEDQSLYGMSNVFYANKKFYFYVKLSQAIGNYPSIVYCVYKVDNNGKQTYSFNVVQENVKPDSVWFYQPVVIYNPGRYNVFVYPKAANGKNGNMLTSGTVIIK